MKLIHYDESRELLLTRIHDGHGNIFVFSIPPGIPLKEKDVLINGELIALKEKGKNCMRIDSTSDPYYRVYNTITPLERDIDPIELETLLRDKRKSAPIPGEEKRYPQPQVEPYLKTHTENNAEIIKGFNFFKFTKQDGSFYYKNNKIVEIDGRNYLFSHINCDKCSKPIALKAAVRFRDGLPWAISRNNPIKEKAQAVKPKSPKWLCEKCATGKQQEPQTELQQKKEINLIEEQVISPPPAVNTKTDTTQVPTGFTLIPDHNGLSIFKILEDMALNDEMDDKAFRGAAWMLCRCVGGGLCKTE